LTDREGRFGPVLTLGLAALASNWKRIAALAAPAECAAVVKADAYGLGIEQAVPALRDAGCRSFFVALPQEGRRVRAGAPDATIYVLNGFASAHAAEFAGSELTPVLNTVSQIEAWAGLGRGWPSAIHVDTGMNRLGLSLAEAFALARRPALLEAAAPRLLMSHLACADTPRHPLNQTQLAGFQEVRSAYPSLRASLSNSAGVHLGPDFRFDLVRPGIALYGAAFAQDRPPLANVVALRACILQLRDVEAGETIGYGAAWRFTSAARVAIVGAGYADGYPRAAGSSESQKAPGVFLRGRRAPVLGRVSMDLIAADVTGIADVSEGDWVELFGPNIPVDEVAAAAGTIGYELLVRVGGSVERLPENGGA
jgi:alanine racemase